MAKKDEIDFDVEIAKLRKQKEAKAVADKKAKDKRLALRAAKIKRNERANEVSRQNRASLVKSMAAIVSKAQKGIMLNGGGPREEALLAAIVEYAKPVEKTRKAPVKPVVEDVEAPELGAKPTGR